MILEDLRSLSPNFGQKIIRRQLDSADLLTSGARKYGPFATEGASAVPVGFRQLDGVRQKFARKSGSRIVTSCPLHGSKQVLFV